MPRVSRYYILVALLFGCSTVGTGALDPASVFAVELHAGAVQGTVTDLAGAVVQGARVSIFFATASNGSVSKTGYEVFTDDKGRYRIEGVTPGVYYLSIASRGFEIFAVENLSVGSGELWQVNATLTIANSKVVAPNTKSAVKRLHGTIPREISLPRSLGQESQEPTAVAEVAKLADHSSGSVVGTPSDARGVVPLNRPPASPGATGPFVALVVGVVHYPRMGDNNLVTAVHDAEAVEAILRTQYGFQTRLLRDATRSDILTALSQYRLSLSEDASFLIYFAGHGTLDREADKAYWLPADAERNNSSNWIIADEITSAIRAMSARHVLVVADSCYSGGLTRDVERAFTPEQREIYLQKMSSASSRTVLSSGGLEPVSDQGGQNNHSVFASAFLDGLQRMGSPVFTAEELFSNYLRIGVAGRSQQVPEYNFIRNSGTGSGDFVFVRIHRAVMK